MAASVVQPYMFEPESDPDEGEEAPADPQTPRIQQDASEWLVKEKLSIFYGTFQRHCLSFPYKLDASCWH